VRDALKTAGLPNLWTPKTVVHVDAIPVLGSGKMDLKMIQQIAIDCTTGEA